MVEWNGGVDYWSGLLDWITGVPRPQMHTLVRNFHGYKLNAKRLAEDDELKHHLVHLASDMLLGSGVYR